MENSTATMKPTIWYAAIPTVSKSSAENIARHVTHALASAGRPGVACAAVASTEKMGKEWGKARKEQLAMEADIVYLGADRLMHDYRGKLLSAPPSDMLVAPPVHEWKPKYLGATLRAFNGVMR